MGSDESSFNKIRRCTKSNLELSLVHLLPPTYDLAYDRNVYTDRAGSIMMVSRTRPQICFEVLSIKVGNLTV